MKNMRKVVVLLLLVTMLVGCVDIQAKESASRIITYSKIKVTLPSRWTRSAVEIKNDAGDMMFISTKNKKDGGILATLMVCNNTQWKEKKKNLPNYKKLAAKGGRVYYVVVPSDVQCGTSKKSQKVYNALNKQTKLMKAK